MLDKRLRCAASMVRPGSRIADIGTDHAYLPLHLVQAGLCPSAIATDIRPGPAASARRHAEAAGLEDRIAVRLGDGLSCLAPDEADDIVIAGMGGETIAAILDAAPWVRAPRYLLVLQPMTRPEKLRGYLLTHGFAIREERVVEDGTHLYTVMTAVYTGDPPVFDEAAWYRGALATAGQPFLKKEIRRLHQQEKGRRLAGLTEEADRLARLIRQLEESL